MSSGQTSNDSAPQGEDGPDTTSVSPNSSRLLGPVLILLPVIAETWKQYQIRLFNLELQTRMKEDKAIKDGIEDAQKSVKDR